MIFARAADHYPIPSIAKLWMNDDLADAHCFLMSDRAGQVVGGCGLNAVDEPNRRANLGYWLQADHVGNGYATAATIQLARFGLQDAGLQRVEVIMSVHNTASRRVAERTGATDEGRAQQRLVLHDVSHDAHLYSFVSGDPACQRADR